MNEVEETRRPDDRVVDFSGDVFQGAPVDEVREFEAAVSAAERLDSRMAGFCRRANAEFKRLARERPLAVGLGAIAIGLIAGRLLPRD